MDGVTHRLKQATNFFETNKKAYYLLTGRVNVGAGQSVALNIHEGVGNNNLPKEVHHPGYTTFVVASLDPDNVTLSGPPPVTEYGVYQFVTKTLGYRPEILAQEQSNTGLDVNKLDIDVLHENCLFIPNPDGNGGKFCTQLPISRELQTPGQLLSGGSNNDDTTRMNLLYFMNPDELADCFEQGLFHQLEYYSDSFQTTFTARMAVHTQNFKLKNNNKNPTFMQYLIMLQKVLMESFIGIEAFTGSLDVKMGNPDTVYMYMVYKHYVKKIQELTNELTILNTEAANESNPSKIDRNTNIRQRKYTELRRLILEMDVWNYSIQTSKSSETPYLSANHTNFSALGISRDPSDYNTAFDVRRLATYGVMGGTKPPSCYPRWMAHTFSAMKVIEDMPLFNEGEINAAVDINVLLFNESRPTTQQMLIFSNTQSILTSAQQNRAQLANATAQQKLQILLDTRTTPDNNKTVRQELAETTASQNALKNDMRKVREMSNEDFLAFTGTNKSIVRAQQALETINLRLSNRNYRAFEIGDLIEMPITEKAAALREQVRASGQPLTLTELPTEVSVDLPNPKVRIISYTTQNRDNTPDIAYECINLDGTGKRSIFQLSLLSSKSNVALANSNLIQRAIQTVEGVGPQSGVDFKTAARLLGREDGIFKATDPNIDVEEKLYAAKLDVLNSRQLLNNNEAQDIADATIYKMRVYQRAQLESMERIAQIEANQQQLQALTARHGEEYSSESQQDQKYIFMKYELYKRKWRALNRSWNELHKIDAITAQPNGKRPPLETWTQTTGEESSNETLSAPVRVIKVAFALRAFDFVTVKLGLNKNTGLIGNLRNQIFITSQTLADTWNMGVLKSFSEWVAMDPEVSHKSGFYTEEWYSKWLETSRRLNQLVLTQAMETQAQQRQDRTKQRGNEDSRDGTEYLPDRDKRKTTTSSSSSSSSSANSTSNERKDGKGGDDDVEMDMGGGRKKKKTRKRRKNTRRRKKMKGGKKTKNKHKNKKSKTRRKRGGRDCNKILKEEGVCDKKGWMKASRRLHPDKGGDGDKFRNMNECYQENKANLSCSKKENSSPVEQVVSPKKIDKNEGKSVPLSKINTDFSIKNSKVLTKEDPSLPKIKNILGIE